MDNIIVLPELFKWKKKIKKNLFLKTFWAQEHVPDVTPWLPNGDIASPPCLTICAYDNILHEVHHSN